LSVNPEVIIGLNGEYQNELDLYKFFFKQFSNLKIVAADGGAKYLKKIGLLPETIIGDLDSLETAELNFFKKAGSEFIKYSAEKDETDGELALLYCQECGFKNVAITGALGGRFDQQLANLFLLEYADELGIRATLIEPGIEIGLIYDKHISFKNKTNSKLSLIPLSRQVKGVSIKGCKYNIEKQSLYRYKTRGISNIIKNDFAEVSLTEGKLLYLLRN